MTTAGTAASLVEDALRHITVLDSKETPTAEDYSRGVRVLDQLIQHEFGDVMSAFQTKRVEYTVPAGTQTITIGTGGDIQENARKVLMMFYGTLTDTRHEIKEATEREIFRRTYGGAIPTRFLQEMQADESINVTLWPFPQYQTAPIVISLGLRVPSISAETDMVMLPKDVQYALSFVLGARLRPEYGIPISDIADVIQKADQKEAEWKAHSAKNYSVTLSRR